MAAAARSTQRDPPECRVEVALGGELTPDEQCQVGARGKPRTLAHEHGHQPAALSPAGDPTQGLGQSLEEAGHTSRERHGPLDDVVDVFRQGRQELARRRVDEHDDCSLRREPPAELGRLHHVPSRRAREPGREPGSGALVEDLCSDVIGHRRLVDRDKDPEPPLDVSGKKPLRGGACEMGALQLARGGEGGRHLFVGRGLSRISPSGCEPGGRPVPMGHRVVRGPTTETEVEGGSFDVTRFAVSLGDGRLHAISLTCVKQPKGGGSDERMQEVDPVLTHGDHSGVPDLVERPRIGPERVQRGTQHAARNAEGGDRHRESRRLGEPVEHRGEGAAKLGFDLDRDGKRLSALELCWTKSCRGIDQGLGDPGCGPDERLADRSGGNCQGVAFQQEACRVDVQRAQLVLRDLREAKVDDRHQRRVSHCEDHGDRESEVTLASGRQQGR